MEKRNRILLSIEIFHETNLRYNSLANLNDNLFPVKFREINTFSTTTCYLQHTVEK